MAGLWWKVNSTQKRNVTAAKKSSDGNVSHRE
mgnify:CR=1 FL=1